MPSSSVGGIPPSGWNCMPSGPAISAGRPGVDNATFGITQPGSAAVGGSDGAAANSYINTHGFGIPECHNPLAGAVPVLPSVSVQLLLQELITGYVYFY